jgi:hypothetical protein
MSLRSGAGAKERAGPLSGRGRWIPLRLAGLRRRAGGRRNSDGVQRTLITAAKNPVVYEEYDGFIMGLMQTID